MSEPDCGRSPHSTCLVQITAMLEAVKGIEAEDLLEHLWACDLVCVVVSNIFWAALRSPMTLRRPLRQPPLRQPPLRQPPLRRSPLRR